MFKDEKIERTKPSNRVLVTVNKSKNREEIRRHLFFVYSIVHPLTRKSLHHVDPEGKGRGGHSTTFFTGRLPSVVQPLTLLNTILEDRFPYHF